MYVPILKLGLLLMNFGILSFLVMLMIDHYKANYSLISWSSGFHVLSFSWLMIKGIFWLLTISSDHEWEAFQFYLLYWSPAPLEFASYMIMPLFFGQVLYPEFWNQHSRWILPVYGVSTLVLIFFMVTWAVLAAMEQDQKPCDPITAMHQSVDLDDVALRHCFQMVFSSDAFRIVSSCCFIVLAGCQMLFALKLGSITDEHASHYVQFFLMEPRGVSAVCYVLFCSFLSQGVYEILATLEIITNPTVDLSGKVDVTPLVFVCFAFWDYLPTVLLVATLTNRRIGSGGSKSGDRSKRVSLDNTTSTIGSGELQHLITDNVQQTTSLRFKAETGRAMDFNVRSALVSGSSVRSYKSEGSEGLAVPRSIFDDPNRYSALSPGYESTTAVPFSSSALVLPPADSAVGILPPAPPTLVSTPVDRGAAHMARRKRGESMSDESGLHLSSSHSSTGMATTNMGSYSSNAYSELKKIDPFPRNPADVTSLPGRQLSSNRLSANMAPSSLNKTGSYLGSSSSKLYLYDKVDGND